MKIEFERLNVPGGGAYVLLNVIVQMRQLYHFLYKNNFLFISLSCKLKLSFVYFFLEGQY